MAIDTWEYGWQWHAACRGQDSSLFFAPNHLEMKEQKDTREQKAKALCRACPVREECLEFAIRIQERHGIWGGLNELERRLLVRRRERDLHRVES